MERDHPDVEQDIATRQIISVRVRFDAEAGVWVATSEDIDGLAVEGANLDALYHNVRAAVPVLVELNGLSQRKQQAGANPRDAMDIRLDIRDHVTLGGTPTSA